MRALAVTAAVTLAAGAVAQATHLVGPGGHAQIDDALAVAAPGDTILVQPGSYSAFHATFGVTIRATVAGVPLVVTKCTATLATGQELHVVDLRLQSIAIQGGRSTLTGCTVSGFPFNDSVSVDSGVLHLARSTVATIGGIATSIRGLVATQSYVSATDCHFHGGDAVVQTGIPAGAALLLQDATLVGSHLTAIGGRGLLGSPNVAPAAAVLAAGASAIWISDSQLIGGSLMIGPPTACAIAASNGRLVRCTLVPNCPSPLPTTGSLLSARDLTTPVSPGTHTVEFRTDPNAPLAVLLASGTGSATLAGIEQPIALALGGAVLWHLGLTDASGQALVPFPVPAGMAGHAWWIQAIGGPTLPLQASPLTGGFVH